MIQSKFYFCAIVIFQANHSIYSSTLQGVQWYSRFFLASWKVASVGKEPKMKYNILDDIDNHFVDRAAELLKSG